MTLVCILRKQGHGSEWLMFQWKRKTSNWDLLAVVAVIRSPHSKYWEHWSSELTRKRRVHSNPPPKGLVDECLTTTANSATKRMIKRLVTSAAEPSLLTAESEDGGIDEIPSWNDHGPERPIISNHLSPEHLQQILEEFCDAALYAYQTR